MMSGTEASADYASNRKRRRAERAVQQEIARRERERRERGAGRFLD